MKVFSQDWAHAYHLAINANPKYAATSPNWEWGKLAMVLREATDSRAVLLDLFRGDCRGVSSVTAETATAEAAFVIEGSEAIWREVLEGRLAPLMGLMTGRLKLSKGSLARLMPYTTAAAELVNSARQVPSEF
ncbi:MAG: Fis family transcriptional regulator [Anaerolineae bacterium]|nr:Fis family transcriptional regulator [Anaerolineae bacterium]